MAREYKYLSRHQLPRFVFEFPSDRPPHHFKAHALHKIQHLNGDVSSFFSTPYKIAEYLKNVQIEKFNKTETSLFS